MTNQDYKIFSFLKDAGDSYKEPIERVSGLKRDPKDIIRTIEFYSNNQFLSSNEDELGREKPFYNVGNYRVTVAKTATDIDVKDIRFEPDKLKHSVQAMLYNHELFKFLKESNFSLTLNEMGLTRPKYGGVLINRHKMGDKLEIGVIDWVNMDFDPGDILGGALIETHWLQPSEVMAKSDVWYEVDDFMEAHSKQSKGKVMKMQVKKVTGEFPMTFYKECEATKEAPYVEKDEDKKDYKRMCFYIGISGNEKFMLYYELEKELNYKYLPWEKVGKGLGRGVWEEGFQAQVWTNDAMISGKNATDLTGKVLLATDSHKVGNAAGNAITGVDNGHIFELEQGRKIEAINLGPSKLPELEKIISLWDTQFNKVASTFDANTGENPPADQPYSSTVLLNQVANSPFEYRREEWGIFLNEVLNEWILPHLKSKILSAHYLTSEFDNDELDLIDEAIINFESNKVVKEKMLESGIEPEEQMAMMESMRGELRKSGKKREIRIPEKFLDVGGKITANITGELKNKQAILQSLDGIFKSVMSTFNPQTGTFAALEDETLNQIFSQIVEMAGVPFSSGQLRAKKSPQPNAPTPSPLDLKAIDAKSNGKIPATV